jgi:hypothetical protein
MKHVKQSMIEQTYALMMEANMSDADDLNGNRNDLDPSCANQEGLYGHYYNALKILGVDMEATAENGELCYEL